VVEQSIAYMYLCSRKTHIQFIIRDWISTKPLKPLTEKIKQFTNVMASKGIITAMACDANVYCTIT
jgi:hypothetical protein